jgi:hypothetical protein
MPAWKRNDPRMIRTVPARALRAFALAALLLPTAWAQEAAIVRRATELRETPGDQGRSLAALAAQTPVTRTSERQGPWVQVRTAAGATGWVHLFDVGSASAATTSPSSGGALRSVTGLFSAPRTNQTGTTAGIRGLEAADLAQAQPNPSAVAQMEGLRQNEAEARSFANRAALRPATVPPLPAAGRDASQPGNNYNPSSQ